MKVSICATGDSIMMNPPPREYNGGEELKKIIDKADIRINNLEMVLSNYDCFASTFCGGTWLTSPPETLEELLAFGFNYFSIANNHTMDYSYNGLESTLATLEKHGIAFSGAGKDLAEASRPAFLEAGKSKVGLISICATNDDAARAGYARPPIPGRPGLNPLRHSEVYNINSSHMNALKEIAKNTCINGRIDNSKKGGYTIQKPGLFSLGAIDFKESDVEGKTSSCNKNDMARTKNVIENALKEASYLVVLVHSHEIKGLTDDEPDYFLEEFARSCIDWGASAVIGSGTHQLKAIEIYKGKPIFYSIANFIFQSDASHYMPQDYYEKYDIPTEYTAEQAIAIRSANGTRGLNCDFMNFRAIMPFMEFEDGKLCRLVLYPLEMGFAAGPGLRGYPNLADEKTAKEIADRLVELSTPYGTKLSTRKNRIVVTI
ncbi:hypothetical protein SDC9_05273 [bioreactor metagenome]|jgi:poly-gamma-glutamate capsule biosynthesis protein CapA/YwtB (metallophosphatase superfamily)|uniref:Capsule synthesis protein CapA domain-containing protein n=1 Tax=bioreactor metagenome TaxID=1076179 RepID=A0A644SYF0_9ZZZZ|nr:CapA family protein [Spirochaetales bacterium]NLX45458.1 CapA family protein [Treponema sp.]VBB39779.1 conserved hypothetical protein [uncultured Spirochaetota bacterium]